MQLSYTVFVGSPQEQKITLKNDGAVAAQVTLSGLSAPYALVQTAVLLSGGQRLEVGVRFDPTASGSFSGSAGLSLSGTCVRWSEEVLDGRSRCLEQSVAQGSVNAALAGLAHKIKLEPEGLNFGVVFIGSSKELGVVIKNEGTTTITLEIPATTLANSPHFRITALSQNPLVLGPGQSGKVNVEFRATASGTYADTARLLSGMLSLDIPLLAKAMTREEYLQQVVAIYNAARQQGDYAALLTRANNRVLNLVGLPELSVQDVEFFLNMYDQVSSPDLGSIPPNIAQALQILQQIGEQQLQEWLWKLVLAERAGQFEQEYSRLLQEGFDLVVQAVQLVTPANQEDVKATLHQFVRNLATTVANNLHEALRILEQRLPFGIDSPVTHRAYQIYLQHLYSIGFPPGVAELNAGIKASDFYLQFSLSLRFFYTNAEKNQYEKDVVSILEHLLNTMVDPSKRANLADGLKGVIADIAKGGSSIPENKALIHAAAVSVRTAQEGGYGWNLVGIRKKVGNQSIDLVLHKPGYYLAGSKEWVDALSLINFYSCGGDCSPIQHRVMQELDAIMQNLATLKKEYNANFVMVGVVFVGSSFNLAGIVQKIYTTYGSTDAAIFVIWEDISSRQWFVCIGGGCSKMSPGQRKDEACRQGGMAPRCDIREWEYTKPDPNWQEPPPSPKGGGGGVKGGVGGG